MNIRTFQVRTDLDFYLEGDLEAFRKSYPGLSVPTSLISELRHGIEAIHSSDYVQGFTAENEFEQIGFIVSALQSFYTVPYVYIESIYVGESYRGAGTAEQLISHAESWGKERGAQFIQLDVSLSNERARASYKNMGFIETRVQMEKSL